MAHGGGKSTFALLDPRAAECHVLFSTSKLFPRPAGKPHKQMRRFHDTSGRWVLALICAVLAVSAWAGVAARPASAGEPAPVKILAYGDSLVHGYGLPAGDTFPEQLEAALVRLGLDVKVINAGNSGDTTAAGLSRLDWVLADDPGAVILALGGNDALRGIDPGDTYGNLDAILSRLTADGLPVLLAGMLAPRNLGKDYAAEFDAVFPRLAEKHGVALYPFFLEGVALDPALNQDDGIHPNAAGVAVLVERITPPVLRLIEEIARRETRVDG